MHRRFQFVLLRLLAHSATPNLGEIEKEQLRVSRIQTGQLFQLQYLGTVDLIGQPVLVGAKGLFDAPIVGDIFALSIFTVDVLAHIGHCIVTVLLDQTFGSFMERIDGKITPPTVQIALTIKQSPFVVKTMG
jgi:hypothetical protein